VVETLSQTQLPKADDSGGKPEPVDVSRALRSPRIKDSQGYKTFRVFNAIAMWFVVAVTLLPFVNIVARSFSSYESIRAGRVTIFPIGFTTHTYTLVLHDPIFWNNYKNTIYYTIVPTIVSMVLTTSYAYVLSKRKLKGHTFLLWVAVFTLFFNGGLIPNFVLVTRGLHLGNTVWAIALPSAISVFNLLVMRAFFENLPDELEEAASVDGMSTYGILFKIVLPLSKAVLATMVLFYSVQFWNSWFSAYLYMDHLNQFPVTLYLRNLLVGATGAENAGGNSDDLLASAQLQPVTIVLTSLPILLLYPFIQKYFVRGVLIGAVKG